MARAGFVILSNKCGDQLLRLTNRLASSFDGATCACHHDFGQTPVDVTRFGSHVRFVQPYIATAWGDFSLVSATIAALRLLYQHDDPDYVTLLSGSDYPLKRQAEVLRDLDAANADAFCELHLVCPFVEGPQFGASGWPHKRRETLRRYHRITWPLPTIFGNKRFLRISTPWITKVVAPYSKSFRCWAGPQWMTLGRRAAHAVLEWHDRNPWLERYLRSRPTSVADESYIHSILGNAPELRIEPRIFRYYEWQPGSSHPEELTLAHVPRLLQSTAHFARKFAEDSPALDVLDEWLDRGVVTPALAGGIAGRYTS